MALNDTHFVSLKLSVCFMYCVRFHIVLLFPWKVIIYLFLLVQELKSKDIWIYNHSPFVKQKAETFHAILESLCTVTELNHLHAICSYFTVQLILLNHKKIPIKAD